MPVSNSAQRQTSFQADDRQQQAIDHVHGPLLVVAGAGTGKTTVLTRRIANLVREGHARPDEILAVTYTENAAREMCERVHAELRGTDLKDLRVTTFHAYCNSLLINSGKQFGVLDDKNLWVYLRRRLPELQLKHFVRAANITRFLDDLLDFMRRCQDELVGPDKYRAYVSQLERGQLPVPRVCRSKEAAELTDEEILGRCQEIANVFEIVEHMLEKENLGTFGHMITRAYELLCDDAGLRQGEQRRARYILVDEFQDANFAQVKVLQQLAGEELNIFAVGDPDQAIYRFRGASSAAFELFHRHFPGASLVVLEKNRRSTAPILNCAFAVVRLNPELSGPERTKYHRSRLVSARDEEAARSGRTMQSTAVEVVEVPLKARDLESNDVVMAIKQAKRETRCRWKDIAVLYRIHSHRDELAAELAAGDVPFTIENMDVMDTPESRDLFSCVGAVVSEADAASLLRVAALPQFAIDPEKLRGGLRSLPRDVRDATVAVALRNVPGGDAVLEVLRRTREEIAQASAKGRPAVDIVVRQFALDRTSPVLRAVLDFIDSWQRSPVTESGELAELLDYLEHFREARGAICLPSQEDDAVRLMTAHTAKGLEFNHVFILRANAGSFPCSYREPLVEFPPLLRDPDSITQEDDKILHGQEERRLFYVAMTRARDTLTIYARQGRGKKDPTPDGFMRELLKDRTVAPWLQKRAPHGFQTDLFGEAAQPSVGSRTSQWMSLPPLSDLKATLSASAIDTYGLCPLRFKLEREWRVPREAPAAMQYGAVMHNVLRDYYASVQAGRPLQETELLEKFITLLTAAKLADPYQHKLYEEQGMRQLREFLEAWRQAPSPDVLHTEERFELKVAGTNVVGRIDRMDRSADGCVVVTDYKTGKPKSQEDADDSLQLSIYAMAAREKWGHSVSHLAFYNLEGNTPVITRRSAVQLQEAMAKIACVAENIAAGKFEAKPGFHCRFCPYFNLCPETEKRVHQPTKAKNNDAQKT